MKVQAYLYDGYWEDIGTIKAFYDSNLALTDPNPKFSFFDRNAPIYTQSRYLPPSKIMSAQVTGSVLGDGCLIMDDATIDHSVVGLRSIVNKGATVKDCLLMGADYYQTEAEIAAAVAAGKVPIGIGAGSTVTNCIVDKNACIGKNVQIINKEGVQEAKDEANGYWIRDGIVTIIKDAEIPDGTIL